MDDGKDRICSQTVLHEAPIGNIYQLSAVKSLCWTLVVNHEDFQRSPTVHPAADPTRGGFSGRVGLFDLFAAMTSASKFPQTESGIKQGTNMTFAT